jgi:hypothetical protein
MRRKTLTRRETIEETSGGMAAAGLFPLPKLARPAIATDATAANPLPMEISRTGHFNALFLARRGPRGETRPDLTRCWPALSTR